MNALFETTDLLPDPVPQTSPAVPRQSPDILAPKEPMTPVPSRLAPRRSRGRIIKLAVAAMFLAAGGYALLAQSAYVASDQAVVSAYTVTLRAPVEGYLADSWLAVGATVRRGEVLAHLRNTDTDGDRLYELRQRMMQAAAGQDAVVAEETTLRGLQDTLLHRGQAHDGATTRVLAGQVLEAARVLEAKLVLRDQQQRESERQSTLERSGFAAHAEADRLRAAAASADRDAEAQRARLEALVVQKDAAQRGVMVDTSGADVTYSAQRADELTIRLAELDRQHALHAAEATALAASLAAEERRVARLSDTALTAPATGMVWKMSASDGERLAVGDQVAQVVDCQAAFLLVPVPQDRLSQIAVGSEVRFRLAGETLERLGRIADVSGESPAGAERNLAAVPPVMLAPTGTLRVALSSRNEQSACLVGRRASVLIPAGGDSLLRKFGRWIF